MGIDGERYISGDNMKSLLKFEADWCGPCQQLKPIVKQHISDHPDVVLDTVNVDDPQRADLVVEHGVRAIPTLVLLEDGEVKARRQNTLPAPQLDVFVSQ